MDSMPDLNRGFLSMAETTLAFEQTKWLKVSAMFSVFVCLLFQGEDSKELFDVMCVSIYTCVFVCLSSIIH